MITGDQLKRRIEKRIFAKPPASDITISHVNTTPQTLSGYYGFTKANGSQTITVGVPYLNTAELRQFNSFGTTNDGQVKFAVPQSITLQFGDTITLKGKSAVYEIIDVQDLYFNEVSCGLLVTTKVRL